MKKVLGVLGALVLLVGIGMFVAIQTATVVRQLKAHDQLTANGVTEKTRTADALDYAIAIDIAAPPPVVWALLTDAKAYPEWNSTVVKLDGNIAKTETIHLVAKIAPERTFDLKVTEFVKHEKMTWEDGGKAFAGVRNFTLTPIADGNGTRFAMSETFSGRMLPMIEGSLPDFTADFNGFASDLKTAAEKVAPPMGDAPAAPPDEEAAAPADAGQ
jgi:hypothetical protein